MKSIIPFAAPKKELIHSFRQSSDYFERMMLGLDLPAIRKKRKHFGMFYILLFVNEISEHRERSSWLNPAMHEGEFHTS